MIASAFLVATVVALANGLPPVPTTATSLCVDTPVPSIQPTASALEEIITSNDFTGGLIPISGFKGSCYNIYSNKEDTAVISACCKTGKGWNLQNIFHLGKCIQNLNGKLVSDYNGNFWRSCKSCGLKDPFSPTIYRCMCETDNKNGPKQFVETTIELNDFIGNTAGVLACHGIPFTRIEGSCSPDDF